MDIQNGACAHNYALFLQKIFACGANYAKRPSAVLQNPDADLAQHGFLHTVCTPPEHRYLHGWAIEGNQWRAPLILK